MTKPIEGMTHHDSEDVPIKRKPWTREDVEEGSGMVIYAWG
jgi:hypothetical protein